MREVFLSEPVGDPRLFAAVTGNAAGSGGSGSDPGERVVATLGDHAIVAGRDGIGLAPTRRPGARAEGFVLKLDRPARDRLDFFMAAVGAAPLVAGVEAEGRRLVVDTYVLPATAVGRDWSRAEWDGEWHDLACEAAEEIARLRGRHEAARMPALLPGIGFRALARARGSARRTPATLRSEFGPGDVEMLSRDPAYTNYFAVEEYALRFRRYDGEFSPVVDRAVFVSGDAVTVLPYDPKRDLVMLVEQFRCGPLGRGDPNPWCLEVIAGRCDPMETAEATARREAHEEAGLTLGRVERIGSYYSSVGVLAEYLEAYVGEADLSAAGGTFGLDSEAEDIRSLVVPLGTALDAVANGEVSNAPAIIALSWLEKHAPRLRRDWGAA